MRLPKFSFSLSLSLPLLPLRHSLFPFVLQFRSSLLGLLSLSIFEELWERWSALQLRVCKFENRFGRELFLILCLHSGFFFKAVGFTHGVFQFSLKVYLIMIKNKTDFSIEIENIISHISHNYSKILLIVLWCIHSLSLRFSLISLWTSPLYALLTVPWAAHANSPRDRKQKSWRLTQVSAWSAHRPRYPKRT